MIVRRIVASLGLLAFALTAPLAAQGLGDTAARERAKRTSKTDAKKEPAKVFTNQDLDDGRPPGSKPASEGTGAPVPRENEASDSSDSSPETDRREQERTRRVSAAQQQVTQAETQVRALADRLNPMSTSYIYGTGGSNDANEELRIRAELRQAETDLQAARQSVVTATRRLEDFRLGRSVPRPE
jgi:hypothetical protein